jgi:hypothetical protein
MGRDAAAIGLAAFSCYREVGDSNRLLAADRATVERTACTTKHTSPVRPSPICMVVTT